MCAERLDRVRLALFLRELDQLDDASPSATEIEDAAHEADRAARIAVERWEVNDAEAEADP